MKANETRLQPLIEGVKQYVVPLFQRPYSWEKKHWKVLWDDLLNLYEDEKPKSHFLGSIVTTIVHTVPEGVQKFLLIDGQQRLTTLFILLCVLRDYASSEKTSTLAEQIQNLFLINPYQTGSETFKLLPTQIDRSAFKKLIESNLPFEENSLLTEAYQFFMLKLKALTHPDTEKLKRILVNSFSLVSILLEHDDNPYLIFESLNAKGRPLTQGDLLRNYFLMRIRVDQQEAVFNSLWEPMEIRLGNVLTTFFRHFLLRQYAALTEDEIYFTLKNICERQSEEEVIEYLRTLERFSRYYEQFINPALCPIVSIREKLEALKMLDVSTCFPFLLFVFDRFSTGNLSEEEVAKTLAVIENFIIRRDICGLSSNALNKIFAALVSQLSITTGAGFSEALKNILSSKGYPTDKEFKRHLLSASLYGVGERRKKTKFILMCLERAFGDKEKLDFNNLTIEHIMPQTLTDEWKQQLGENWAKDHMANLHTLGNLTLTGYNSELSNMSFAAKKQRFSESRLRLNDYFSECDTWRAEDIKRRAEWMAEKALTLWPYVGDAQRIEQLVFGDVTGARPVQVSILGESIKVSKWVEVTRVTLEKLFSFKPNMVDKAVEAFASYLSKQESSFRRPHQLTNGIYVEQNLSANFSYQFCQRITEFFGVPSDEYIVEVENAKTPIKISV